MFRKAGPIALTLTLLFAGALPLAWAARLQQGRLHRMKACVGLIPTYGDPEFGGTTPADPSAISPVLSPDPNPYVFYVLDQRTDLKPDGWSFYNPAASIFVNNDQSLRWNIPLNSPLTPDMAPYWEQVISDANYDALARMDVIYIPIARAKPVHFTEEQRRVLTRLADAGVTIWVDWAVQDKTAVNWLGGAASNTKDQFFTNLDTVNGAGQGVPPVVEHPLLDSQFYLDPVNDAPEIGSRYGANGATPAHAARAFATQIPGVQPNANFTAVIANSGMNPSMGAYIAAGRFGAGFVVATAGNVGGAISTLGDGGLRAAPYTAGTIVPLGAKAQNANLYNAEPEDLKFAYNMFAWRNEVTAAQKNGRHTTQGNAQLNGLIEQATYPFLVRPPSANGTSWKGYPVPGQPLPVSNPVPPLVLDNAIIAYTQYVNPYNNQLVSELNLFDQDPNRYFTGGPNAIADDPLTTTSPATNPMADYSIGQPYDRIQSLGPDTLGTNFPLVTGMCIGELPDPRNAGQGGQGGKPYVFVAGPGGGAFGSGLFSIPVSRPGYPTANPADAWNAANISAAPPTGVAYTGAPAFAVIPGTVPAGFTSTTVIPPLGQLYAGGQYNSQGFLSQSNGKVTAFSVDMSTGKPVMSGSWYYPPNQESNRMGVVSGPVVTAQVVDQGTGAIDQMVFVTSASAGTTTGVQNPGSAGDTTGRVDGFIVATKGDVLSFPRGNNVPGTNTGDSGRRFVSARWLDIPPGTGVVPQPQELRWDPSKYFEVRVMDKNRNYVLGRYTSTGANPPVPLPDGTAGQVLLPAPPPLFQVPGQPGVWDLTKVVLVADYSPLPVQVDSGAGTIRPRFTPATPYFRGQQQVVQSTGVAGGVSIGKDNLIYYGTGQGYMCATEWRRGRAQFRWKIRSLEYTDQAGASQKVDPRDPQYLSDYAFTAAPAAGDRIVFATRGKPNVGGGITGPGTTYVFEPDAVIRFKLNGTPSLTQQQANALMLMGDHGAGLQANNPFLLANQQPWGRVPGQFTVDPDTATVTFQNMENFSLDLSQAKSAAELATAGIDTGGKPAVPIDWKINLPGGATGRAWIPLPLVELYRPLEQRLGAPEQFLTGPTIAGDRIYVMGSRGFMHELPVDPKLLDPRFPAPAPGLQGFDVSGGLAQLYGTGLRRVRQVSPPATQPGSTTAVDAVVPTPAVVQGAVVVSCPRGMVVYNSPNVLIADANRIVEASGDSTTLATTDVVTKHRTQNSEFPIPTDPQFSTLGTNQILQERKILNRPAVVRKLSRSSSFTSIFMSSSVPASDTPTTGAGAMPENALANESYLAADTGNNRAVEFNLAGKVVWEATDFQDPFKFLPAGEPLTIAGPMDVQRWTETEANTQNGPPVIVVHTLIADTGHTRVVELVDKLLPQNGQFTPYSFYVSPGQVGVDGTPVRWYHVLVWTSETNAQGIKLRYRSAQRVFWTNGSGAPVRTTDYSNPPNMTASNKPPYLRGEQYLSYTMCSVNGARVSYADDLFQGSVSGQDYNQFLGAGKVPSMGWLDRIPKVAPGSDSIVFLRGRYKLDQASQLQALTAVPVTAGSMASGPFDMREQRVAPNGSVLSNDQVRFAQGVVDPDVPTITEIFDDKDSPQVQTPVHILRGVNSIQRTIRRDVKFQPEDYGNAPLQPGQYFLIADQDGVWELRMLPLAPGSTTPQMRLNLAFTVGDYAYCTGAGNGDPTQVFNGAGGTSGGRAMFPLSARRLPNGLILVASRMPGNDLPLSVDPSQPTVAPLRYQPDVFLLRSVDYLTARDRGGQPYDIANTLTHGWRPDAWVQAAGGNVPALLQGPPSIRWRAAEALDPSRPPTPRVLGNPNELTGSYNPVQPSFADVVY